MGTGVESEIIAILASYLPYAAQTAAQTLGTNTAQALWEKVRQLFKQKGEAAESTLQDFESEPRNEDYQELAKNLLKKFSRDSPALKQELTTLVENIKQDPVASQFTLQVFGNIGTAIQNSGSGHVIIDQRAYQTQQRGGRTQPPLSVQLDALNQILQRFEREKTRVITLQQLADYIEATALRNNVHPVYSNLTLEAVSGAMRQLLEDGRLRCLKNDLFEIVEQEPPPIPIA